MPEARGDRRGLPNEPQPLGSTAAMLAWPTERSSYCKAVRTSPARDRTQTADCANAERLRTAKWCAQDRLSALKPGRARGLDFDTDPRKNWRRGKPRREFTIEPAWSSFMRSEVRPYGVQVQPFESTHTAGHKPRHVRL